MELEKFKKILECFSDEPDDIEISKGELVVQIRDEIIEASLKQNSGELIVIESEKEFTAAKWIIDRIAHLPQLADRIISYTETEEHFIIPEAKFLNRINDNPDDKEEKREDAVKATIDILDNSLPGNTNILYLTSDAGEGKTTLINQLAYKQAKEFKENKKGWLLLPITLGGRPFLRFDDVVIGSLMNRFRFPFFYYDAFIELVKLGVVIPAFDGFEEMFVESSTGEALSALSSLIQNLSSSGSLLISARKAYFEYKDFRSQAKLYDSIEEDEVSFSKLTLERWNKAQFLRYCEIRNLKEKESFYTEIKDRLDEKHPLLTRAVLVKRLIDVALTFQDRKDLFKRIGKSTDNYFYQFVETIVEREVTKKWIDRSGDAAKPLLTLEEHYTILSMLSSEMWISNTSSLNGDLLELISDLFSDQFRKSPNISRQIKERIKQHSLLVNSEQSRLLFQFDHEEFKDFFLGINIGNLVLNKSKIDLITILQKGSLPKQTIRSACTFINRRGKKSIDKYVSYLQEISSNDSKTSFTRENCGALILKFLNREKNPTVTLSELIFPPNSLKNRAIKKVIFKKCLFQHTEIKNTTLTDCKFIGCKFDRLDFQSDYKMIGVQFENTEVNSIITEKESRVYNPSSIPSYLANKGISVQVGDNVSTDKLFDEIEDIQLTIIEKVFRAFLRSTFINENVLRVRLGSKAPQFFDEMLSDLIKRDVLQEVPYKGADTQKRYKLSIKLDQFEMALNDSNGSYNKFLEMITE
ncbi:MAG: hypothetical protein JJ971_00965 [Balneolaceae bacterium]|nr:hypothetical protein [Balneolaceae bacterium]MBO6544941.1 hypothetical protein [Balneolaceae bacterium]MBO6646337.1 hypothetical protein [Balneolaceae bacterium]